MSYLSVWRKKFWESFYGGRNRDPKQWMDLQLAQSYTAVEAPGLRVFALSVQDSDGSQERLQIDISLALSCWGSNPELYVC